MHGPWFQGSFLLEIDSDMENIPDLLVVIFPI